jgi:hypothetical protein
MKTGGRCMKVNGENSSNCNGCTSTSEVLNKDKSRRIEVQCLLHTLCNLRCKFCFETKEKGIREDTKINIDYIKNLPNEVVELVLSKIGEGNISKVEISMMGGELFFDSLPDSVFDLYREFAYSIQSKLKEKIPGIECKFKCLSNGIYTNHKRVENFLREFGARLILSYDPVDRFTCQSQKDMWFNTFKYFKDKPEFKLTLSAVLTKKTIDAYIDGDEMFEKTGNAIYIDSNIYVPRLDYHDYLASDEDLFRFYKWALDTGKFNISHVNNILIAHQYGICSSSCGKKRSDYMFGEDFEQKYQSRYINKCTEESPLDKEYYYGEYANQIEDTCDCTRYKQPLGLQKRGCLFCDYYSHCPKMCWSQVLFDKYEVGECPIQRVYEYLDNNPIIINNYKQWREKYEKNWLTV